MKWIAAWQDSRASLDRTAGGGCPYMILEDKQGRAYGPPFLGTAILSVDRDICEIKIRAFSQQRLTGKLGERVGETVSEVQSRGVSTLSVLTPGRAGKVDLIGVYGYDLEIGSDHEEIKLAARGLAQSCFENDSSFEQAGSGDQAASGCSDGVEEFLTLRFREKDGCQGGRINDHIGGSTGKSVVVVTEDLVRSAGIQDG